MASVGVALGQLVAVPEQTLVDRFGDVGRHLWNLAHARDDRAVVADREAKSISTETTFAQDIADQHVLRVWLLDLVDHLAARLRKQQVRARTIEIKLRSSDFRTQFRQQALPEATNATEVLWQAAKVLFERSLTGPPDSDYSIHASGFAPGTRLSIRWLRVRVPSPSLN